MAFSTKRRFFRIKWGLKNSFSLKRGNLIWNGLRRKGIYRATYTNCLNIIMGVPHSVVPHQYCHDRDSTDRDSTEFHTEIKF